jgi:hypothetical protein
MSRHALQCLCVRMSHVSVLLLSVLNLCASPTVWRGVGGVSIQPAIMAAASQRVVP